MGSVKKFSEDKLFGRKLLAKMDGNMEYVGERGVSWDSFRFSPISPNLIT
jgi:hypothetical protein